MNNETTAKNPTLNNDRRDFLRRSGAVVSAALVPGSVAAAASLPGASKNESKDEAAIRQLYRDYAASVSSYAESAERASVVRVLHDPSHPREKITIAADGKSAKATFHATVQMAVAISEREPMLAIARESGVHADEWWEQGIHEVACVKTNEGWTIERVQFTRL